MQKISLFLLVQLLVNNKTNVQNTGINYVETDDNVKLFIKKSGSGPLCIFMRGGPGAWSKSFVCPAKASDAIRANSY